MGDNVTFPWEYSETMYGEIHGYDITKGPSWKGVYKRPDSVPPVNAPNTEGFGNAGMTLLNVKVTDSDVYHCQVYFKHGTKLSHSTNLTVDNGKSNKRLDTIEINKEIYIDI